MDKFVEMRTFVAVVEAGSFVGASEALQASKPAVSRLIADLEARLGVRLLHRTTRRLSLTEEGEVFHARCRELLNALDEAEAEITSRSGEASGLLRINGPVSFGIVHLAPLWGKFQQSHPKVALDITLNDRVVDLVEEGYDLAIRIARLPSSSLICRRLCTTRVVLCASPDYLARAGTPVHPNELVNHRILAYSQLATGNTWEFDGPDGHHSIRTSPSLYTNNGDTCRVAALQGAGLILQPTFLVGCDLRSGALVEVLPEYRSTDFGIYAVYPTRKHVSTKVRLMIDFLIESFAQPDWPE
ncbi:LysR family transcriptional regulator [Niveibacterium terrae]|uniref:LysR family transcriptional regulator n=1 Tax=Niveibacterium terrae TaxID=3373598 RepID=UPI003A917AA7